MYSCAAGVEAVEVQLKIFLIFFEEIFLQALALAERLLNIVLIMGQ
jgi:hypothetical protein